MNSDKTHIAVQLVDFAKMLKCNPWGDFGKIAVISFRHKDGGSAKSFYFKITDDTGMPYQMTQEEFNNACIESHLAKQPLPYLVEL